MTPAEDLPRRLRALREQHDPPLKKADAAKLVGVSLRRYSDWELGKAAPHLSSISKIADAYGIPAAQLMGTNGTAPADTGQLDRIEHKIDLLLEHLDILPAGQQVPRPPGALADILDEPQPRKRRTRRAK
jgi:transcriptional regulator with XRE-family HTH domain